MKIPYSFLEQAVDLKNITIDHVLNKINLNIAEVEEVIDFNQSQVVIGEITSIKDLDQKHLSIAKVKINQNNSVNIIFTNNIVPVKTKDRLAVAVAPTKLASGLLVKERKFNEFTSQGMFISNFDLGLAGTELRLIKFKLKDRIGKNVYQALNLSDILIDLKITPNRSDLLSFQGFTRDLAAVLNRKYYPVQIPRLNIIDKNITNDFSLKLTSPSLVPRYSAVKISGLKNQSSPLWLQQKLIASGLRSINAIVDITNYVMLELGQPLHAFDFDKISEINTDRGQTTGEREVIIRQAEDNEKIETLDQIKRDLPKGVIVIADHKKILALAGIMGGEASAISQNSTQIVLESAIFDSLIIRKISKELNLTSEAAYRFERGLDPEMTVSALKRATDLIIEVCGGRISSQIFDLQKSKKNERIKINFSIDRFYKYIGTKTNVSQASTIFQKLGIMIAKKNKSSLEVIPPSWRQDLKIEVDLFEEILRVIGYDSIAEKIPNGDFPPPIDNQEYALEQKIAQTLCSLGWHETINYSFYSQKNQELSDIARDLHIPLTNPTTTETALLRVSLIPGLLKSLENNARNVSGDLALFEIGHIFKLENKKRIEKNTVAGVYLSSNYLSAIQQIKIAIDKIVNLVNDQVTIKQTSPTQAEILDNNQKIGFLQVLSPAKVKFDKKKRIALIFELTLDHLLEIDKALKFYQPINLFPKIERDLSLILPSQFMIGPLIKKLAEFHQHIIDVQLIDIYESQDQRSVTLKLIFQASDKTLDDQEINNIQDQIIKKLASEDKVKIKV